MGDWDLVRKIMEEEGNYTSGELNYALALHRYSDYGITLQSFGLPGTQSVPTLFSGC